MRNKLIICADDYAMNSGISQGILDLAQKSRINAISCMTQRNNWHVYANYLSDLISSRSNSANRSSDIQIGCHLDLTATDSLHKIIARSYLRQWDPNDLTNQIQRQLNAFEDAMQRIPDFIDGHQHVHQLPQVRDVLLSIYTKKYAGKNTWIRNTVKRRCSSNLLKKCLIEHLGGKRFRKILQQNNIPHNHYFSGIYDFKQGLYYAKYFKLFLAELKNSPNSVIMCHPGLPCNDPNDTHPYARYFEWQYLNSEQFLDDLHQFNFILF